MFCLTCALICRLASQGLDSLQEVFVVAVHGSGDFGLLHYEEGLDDGAERRG